VESILKSRISFQRIESVIDVLIVNTTIKKRKIWDSTVRPRLKVWTRGQKWK